MQLLNSPITQQSARAKQHLWDTLQDIVSKVKIQSNFCIRHPDYKPFELSAEIVTRLEQMPLEFQNRYRSLQLRSFLYGIYYNGSMRTGLAADTDSNLRQLDLENNTFLGVDRAFYNRLHQSNNGIGYFDRGWYVFRKDNDGRLVVNKNGLKLHIEREAHLQPSQQNAIVGDSVAIRLPKNLLQNGFYMAIGNGGQYSLNHSDSHPAIVRIYFNITPEGSVAIMAALTRLLNEISIPFSFKVLYNPGDYGSYDSGVLYFEKKNYEAIRLALQAVYSKNQAHFQPEIPLFTKPLAWGLGIAEEPNCKFTDRESFGMNRCQIVANSLVQAWQNGDDSPEARMNGIIENFSHLGIDWQYAYLNANSEDIYIPLNSYH